ncbi:DUF3576 domain-containing protein [Candidatus Magnetaquicoccus inordinatus]|uniref:DUF3576 domain-containing protein n=1 Tax=Candidatus Magnetaquicoccus inordinatus TaxID=2496818 RepID=UPI00102B337C|nr:DUF3576 domain-containing protein [Candidatus Magnetaquicoccus inordinatus]
MAKQGWMVLGLTALLLAGCSGDFWKSRNTLDEHKLSKFGQKKELEDARERNDPNSAFEAGQESIFNMGGDGGGGKKSAESIRADKLFAGAMNVVMGLPIQTASREGGVISTEWKVDPANPSFRYRVNIHITGKEPYGTVQVVVLKQELLQGNWVDRPADEEAAANISKSIRKQAQIARP